MGERSVFTILILSLITTFLVACGGKKPGTSGGESNAGPVDGVPHFQSGQSSSIYESKPATSTHFTISKAAPYGAASIEMKSANFKLKGASIGIE